MDSPSKHEQSNSDDAENISGDAGMETDGDASDEETLVDIGETSPESKMSLMAKLEETENMKNAKVVEFEGVIAQFDVDITALKRVLEIM